MNDELKAKLMDIVNDAVEQITRNNPSVEQIATRVDDLVARSIDALGRIMNPMATKPKPIVDASLLDVAAKRILITVFDHAASAISLVPEQETSGRLWEIHDIAQKEVTAILKELMLPSIPATSMGSVSLETIDKLVDELAESFINCPDDDGIGRTSFHSVAKAILLRRLPTTLPKVRPS
jgi:hypothetical protein